ncbi:MAG TPA: SDR family NAD(P)-dependent oxidoreductase, partial [Usitatibacter sp.]|nr:SDR family NAD(P)-dependent oxidoreductase [Usitatibacter sp.]
MQISNNVFLVTGGGSGLGAATAKMIADEGGKVVIADVADAGDWVAKQLGGSARFVKCDVTDEASMQAAVDACVSSFGAIHGLVNCAGVAPGERVVGR